MLKAALMFFDTKKDVQSIWNDAFQPIRDSAFFDSTKYNIDNNSRESCCYQKLCIQWMHNVLKKKNKQSNKHSR